MTSTEPEALPLERLRQIARGTEARLVVLFGSVARGDPAAESDVDVGVSGLGFWEGLRLGDAIGAALGREPHVVDLDGASDWLLIQVAKDGVVLHAAAEDAWPRFRARAILRWLDFAPIVELCAEGARRRLLAEAGRG